MAFGPDHKVTVIMNYPTVSASDIQQMVSAMNNNIVYNNTITSTRSYSTCEDCGAVISDKEKHQQWHGLIFRELMKQSLPAIRADLLKMLETPEAHS